jgi:hydroxymethylglutaryl-CoA lyase
MSVGVKDIAVFTSTSNTFNKKNTNSTIDESIKRIEDVMQVAIKNNIRVRGYISTAFGCPYEGKTSISEFIRLAKILKDLGVYEVSIGDTIGIAHPMQVKEFLDTVLTQFDSSFFALHFHDTRGLATSNILTAVEMGMTSFDSSSAGLGGCPYAVGASGNVATEDVINLLNSMGVETNIDLDKLAKASTFILSKLKSSGQSRFLKAYLGSRQAKT